MRTSNTKASERDSESLKNESLNIDSKKTAIIDLTDNPDEQIIEMTRKKRDELIKNNVIIYKDNKGEYVQDEKGIKGYIHVTENDEEDIEDYLKWLKEKSSELKRAEETSITHEQIDQDEDEMEDEMEDEQYEENNQMQEKNTLKKN